MKHILFWEWYFKKHGMEGHLALMDKINNIWLDQ